MAELSAVTTNVTASADWREGERTLIIRTLAELQEPDDRSLFWVPGGKMQPEAAAEYQQNVIGQLELADQVPETTRMSFERLRTLYSYGIMCYDLYTVAGDLARLVTEQALRERFLPFYEGTVRFTDQQEKPQAVAARTFDEMYDAIRRDDGRLRGWKLQMRNHVAHHSYQLYGPDQAGRAIADLAHIINRLWGAPSGTLVSREPVVIAWTDESVTWGTPGRFNGFPDGGEHTAVVVLADPNDPGLADFDAPYESTYWPCDLLCGPGTWAEAGAWLGQRQPSADQAETIDRLFLIQYDGDLLYLPRNSATAAALGEDVHAGTWYLVRADSPFPAFNHQRRLLAGEPGHAIAGRARSRRSVPAASGKC